MLICSKLKSVRRLLSLSQNDIEKETGMSQRDISQLENGKKKFIPTAYIQFLNNKKVPLDLLFDDSLNLPDFEKRMFQCLQNKKNADCNLNCNPNCNLIPDFSKKIGKTKSTDFIDGNIFLPDNGKTKSTKIIELPVPVVDDPEMVNVPVVDISVAAGSGIYNTDHITEMDCIRFPKSMIKGHQNYLCVRIKGESMVPTLQDGGYLVIRLLDRGEWQYIQDGHVHVVSDTEGRAFVKRLKNRLKEYGLIVCKSDNPDPMGYPSFNLMENEINTIWHAEWYISARMPNIHETYYKKVSEMEDAMDNMRRTVMEELNNMRQEMRREIKALSTPS